jgi:hypothetical protein
MKALMFERFKFGMEGPRFFDLLRWEIAEPFLNAYLNVENLKGFFLLMLSLRQVEMKLSNTSKRVILQQVYINKTLVIKVKICFLVFV